MLIAAGGMVVLAQLGVHSTYAAHIVPGLIPLGVGLGLITAPAMNTATLGVDPGDAGVASATVNTAQQVGGSLGTALLNTIAGVKNIEPNLIRAARCLGANQIRILRRIVLPAALPQIITGIRIGMGFGWMALVAAELIGANSGLGFLINDARTLLRTDYVIVGMITIGLVGLAIDQLVRFLGRRSMPWSRVLGT